MNIFGGMIKFMKVIWILFWDDLNTGLVLGVISMHYRVFSSGQYAEC